MIRHGENRITSIRRQDFRQLFHQLLHMATGKEALLSVSSVNFELLHSYFSYYGPKTSNTDFYVGLQERYEEP
jgi:hypothetical protein